MQGLGRTESVNPVAYANKATSGRSVRGREGAGRRAGPKKAKTGQRQQSAENTNDNVWIDRLPSTSARSFQEYVHELLTRLDSARGPAAFVDKHVIGVIAKIDLNFGVEQLSYKNMWKVLKTVVKEIGDIKEASSGRFFLGVSERMDKAATLMEFGSLGDYLTNGTGVPPEDVLSDAAENVAGKIVSDPAASLEIQAGIVPEMALHLLGPAG